MACGLIKYCIVQLQVQCIVNNDLFWNNVFLLFDMHDIERGVMKYAIWPSNAELGIPTCSNCNNGSVR